MSSAMRQLGLLVSKDLRIHVRTRHAAALVIVLGILVVTVLGLGLGAQHLTGSFAAPAVLWVAYLFSGVLCFEKTMAVERHDGALAALLLAPVDRGLIYVSKLVANLILMLIVVAVITPVAIVLFGFDLSAAPGQFALVISLSMLGFAAVGTLFSVAVSSTRDGGGLLAMAIFPVSLPLVIASTQTLVRLFRDGVAVTGSALGIIIAFAVIYMVVSWIVCEVVLEP